MSKLSPKVMRFAFYGAVAAGILFLCATLTLRSLNAAGTASGINPAWLAGLCCLIPIVLAGMALANESR
jgi:hypothetical protein